MPEYMQTAAVWINGILSMYGVKPESVTYYVGSQEDPSRRKRYYFAGLAETGEYVVAEAVDLIERVIGGGVKFELAAGFPLSLISLGESNLRRRWWGSLVAWLEVP